jgi:nucleoside-diphosphate-sugar epimerase
MMQALASATTARIVFTSSMTVYEPPLLLPVSEVNVPMPSAAYAAGKWRAEEILMQRRRNGDVALRLPGLFGVERRSGLLFNAIRAFLKGSLFQLSSPPDLWAAMNVDDAAHYVAQAALSDKQHPSEAVNVGYPGTFSIPGVIRKIASLCGTEWAYDGTNGPEFSANLERLRERYGLLSVTFDDRLRELIESVRAELRQA